MTARRFTKALSSSVGARVATGAANYGLFWALAHRLEPQALGSFSVLTAIFFAVQLLPLLGLAMPLIRRVASHPEQLGPELDAAWVFAAPVALGIAGVVGVCGQYAHPELAAPFWLIAATLLPGAWTCVAESALIGRERFGLLARIGLLETVIRSTLALAAVHVGGGLAGVCGAFLLGRCVAAAAYAMHPELPLPRLSRSAFELQRRNWREVPVFIGIALVATLLTRLDVLVLSSLGGLGEAGVYAAATRLYDAAQMLPTVLALIVMPVLSRQFGVEPERFSATLAVALRLVLTFGLGAALPATVLAGPLIQALYPPDMAGATPALRWLAYAFVLAVADVLLSSTMVAAKAQRRDLHALLANLVVLGLGLVVLVPTFGPTGAAAAVVLGLVVRLGLRLAWSVRVLGLPTSASEMLRLAVATALGLATADALLPQGALSAALSALVVYLATVVATGGFGRRPIVRLRADLAALAR